MNIILFLQQIFKYNQMEKLIITNTITISAPASKVWDALTNPELTKLYMFGCETVSTWKPGNSLLWRMELDGKEFIAVKGNIVDIQPEKYLAYTVIDPNSDIEDIPENYLTVTYELKEDNGSTSLIVTQGDYKTVGEGERRYVEAYNSGEGWNPILEEIKKLVEMDS